MAVGTKHLVFVHKNAFQIQAVGLLKGLLEERNRHTKPDKIVIVIRGVTALSNFQDVESEFSFYVRQLVFFVGDRVAVFFLEMGVQDRDRAIRADGVPVIVRGVVSQRAEREGIAVEIAGIAEEGQDKIPAADVMSQVAEKNSSGGKVPQVWDEGPAVGIAVRLLELLPRGI